MIPAHDDGRNIYTHNLLSLKFHWQIVKQRFTPQDSQQALLTFAQVKQPHYRLCDSGTALSDRLDDPSRLVVLHNTISSAYNEKKS